MRYLLVTQDLDEYHPQWPNERVYKIRDTKSNSTSLSCYTNKEVAQKIVDKKNSNAS